MRLLSLTANLWILLSPKFEAVLRYKFEVTMYTPFCHMRAITIVTLANNYN